MWEWIYLTTTFVCFLLISLLFKKIFYEYDVYFYTFRRWHVCWNSPQKIPWNWIGDEETWPELFYPVMINPNICEFSDKKCICIIYGGRAKIIAIFKVKVLYQPNCGFPSQDCRSLQHKKPESRANLQVDLKSMRSSSRQSFFDGFALVSVLPWEYD